MYIGIITSIIAGLTAAAIVYISGRKSIINLVPGEINEQGYTVMKSKSNNQLFTCICYIVGAAACGFSLVYITTRFSNTLMVLSIGVFFILIATLLNKATNDNRIEYNEHEIRQYIIFRTNPKATRWEDIKNVEYRSFGPFLVLSDGNKDIVIDFKNDGITQFLKFASTKLQGKDAVAIKEIMSSL